MERKISFLKKLGFEDGVPVLVLICFLIAILGLIIALSAIDVKSDADFFARLGIGIIAFLLGGSFVVEKYKKNKRR